jgi:hypothetical protein
MILADVSNRVTNTKKIYLYGDALKNQHAAGKELSRLKVHYDLQTAKIELLQEELSLIAAMNYAARRRITTLEDVVESIGGPCSHYDSSMKSDCTNVSINWLSVSHPGGYK